MSCWMHDIGMLISDIVFIYLGYIARQRDKRQIDLLYNVPGNIFNMMFRSANDTWSYVYHMADDIF